MPEQRPLKPPLASQKLVAEFVRQFRRGPLELRADARYFFQRYFDRDIARDPIEVRLGDAIAEAKRRVRTSWMKRRSISSGSNYG
jgi:hypothetical protein